MADDIEARKRHEERTTWHKGELTPVPPEREPEEEPTHIRYILMRHDPNGHNLAYLYEHSHVVETVGNAVDVVETAADSEQSVQFLAEYQLGRLASGLEARGYKQGHEGAQYHGYMNSGYPVFTSIEDARAEAQRVVDLLAERHSC